MNEEKNIPEDEVTNQLSQTISGDEHFTEDPGLDPGLAPVPITSNQQPETTDMEVHHHSHAHGSDSHRSDSHRSDSHRKKNWKSYFWEFLMLFLAVFCGFLAEYQLEHVIENQREKKFIRSFIEDLRSDTTLITRYINSKIEKRKVNDSLIWYLNTPDPNQHGQRIYFFARQLTRTFNFFPADRTIKQLKYSGGLRLIKNQWASDSIMAYDQAIERIMLTQARQENELNEIRPIMGRLMNANILETMLDGEVIRPPDGNPPLRTLDKEFLLDFIYAVHQLQGSDAVNRSRLQKLKERATGIIIFLKKEYHLE